MTNDDAWRNARLPLDSPIDIARLGAIYSSTAAFYDGLVATQQAAAKLAGIEALAPQRGERLLEAGVGTGWALLRLLRRCHPRDLAGIDVAQGMLDVAQLRLREATDDTKPLLVLGDLLALPFPPASFDCVFSSYTLEVMPTPTIAPALIEMRRVLRPDGRLVLVNLTEGEGPDVAAIETWKQGFVRDPEYFGAARPLTLAPLLTGLGFRDVRRRYVGPDWPSEVLLAHR